MKNGTAIVAFVAVGYVSALSGCAKDAQLSGIDVSASRVSSSVPAGLRTVSAGTQQLTLWPFTGTDVAGTASDPVNLIFRGKADPRALRAALLSLDGNRQAFGFPDVFPFNCIWTDAFGEVQTAYATSEGWSGSIVQLQCGAYGPIRFHLRLFPEADWTIASAHFEVLIPGTADHQVLSWELAEKLVVVDFVRSGLLAAQPEAVPALNPAPGYRLIPAIIYNGLPAALKQTIGGPAQTTADIPIGTDGSATMLHVGSSVTPVADTRAEIITLTYNQVIPRPFCSTGPQDYVLVQGPITLTRTVTQEAGGSLTSMLNSAGQLSVSAVNPVTGERGEPGTAEVLDLRETHYGDHQLMVQSRISRKEIRADGNRTSLDIRLHLGGQDQYSATERCVSSSESPLALDSGS
jgi:hypothetical protein